jgi:hypothetical protein
MRPRVQTPVPSKKKKKKMAGVSPNWTGLTQGGKVFGLHPVQNDGPRGQRKLVWRLQKVQAMMAWTHGDRRGAQGVGRNRIMIDDRT